MSQEHQAGSWPGRIGVFVLSGGSIAALLADIFGIASMHLVFWAVSVPSMVLLAVVAVLPRTPVELRDRIRVGAVAGVLGTIGYDLVRVPFAIAGQRLFAPIESYGLLIADANASSALTSGLGWCYHLSNGVTFGIAYCVLMARRAWPWGVLWGLLLESVAVFSPFAARYAIAGQIVPIAIAYGAHVFYGYPVGMVVQNFDRSVAALRWLGKRPVAVILIVSVVAIAGWHRPWEQTSVEREAAALSKRDRPATVVLHDRFTPEWLRVRVGQCILVDNRSANSYRTPFGDVGATSQSVLCFTKPGVHRVRLGTRPYAGGFVYAQD
ncbi:hypothetical protein Rhe02_08030 [Rhizocola hellebori]|uniref:Uncharacterized protein n=1 Tax=Rhizocola hellebori TaxID=1392758 RepID=A0A8J3Q3J5_9ACTN|nr:hypothetical protein [Rhizocola hellebori]GIH02736.1 hypothetical protein Rhe02_08030 [Rhizocola hellebori]